MFRQLKFPLVYVLEGVLFPLMFSGFFVTTSFMMAKPPAGLDFHGKSLPAGWEAAVPSHGRFYEWYLMANHPILFVLGILFWLAPLVPLYRLHKAQAVQRQEDGESRRTAHAVASACVIVALMLTSYWFVFHVAAGVIPT